ncbi:PD-(D/E)XK nuclease family protein [Antarcticibacterium sp. 1MA-6-2]|uniref:PD-(D/E)XK nuclease family protein n=1 Tax=Antarcticibacterium sp. 1MA-6-2 TaxID=2908210 RepID=UPI001F3E8012|nr:PD-(D/E)XK nuclease family protein [Antarcticibacterium sp. 1MA-6-2]UJH90037.1 PD-(D/E)XK nuclease family protein [Antarcticibacterium sp. 1MA-6-2]
MDITDKQELELEISRIISHPDLADYFSADAVVYRERDIISPEGEILRPDRLNFINDRVTIIDYKTGKLQPGHKQQMEVYASILEKMDFIVENKILIYINDDVNIIFV